MTCPPVGVVPRRRVLPDVTIITHHSGVKNKLSSKPGWVQTIAAPKKDYIQDLKMKYSCPVKIFVGTIYIK